jgi:hypothetical protein
LALGGLTPATARRALELFDGSAPGALPKAQPIDIQQRDSRFDRGSQEAQINRGCPGKARSS